MDTSAKSSEARSTTLDVSALRRDHFTEDAAFVAACATTSNRAAGVAEGRAGTERRIAAAGKGLDLSEAQLSGLDLSDFDPRRATLTRAALHSANLSRANLSHAALICAGTERTTFRGAVLKGGYRHAMAAQVCDFRDADLPQLVGSTGGPLHGCKVCGAVLAGAQRRGGAFNGSNRIDASLAGAPLAEKGVARCNPTRSSCAGAKGARRTIRKPIGAESLRVDRAGLPVLRLRPDGARERDKAARRLRDGLVSPARARAVSGYDEGST